MRVTFAEACILAGSTTEEMAQAQEVAEAEEWENEIDCACDYCGRGIRVTQIHVTANIEGVAFTFYHEECMSESLEALRAQIADDQERVV